MFNNMLSFVWPWALSDESESRLTSKYLFGFPAPPTAMVRGRKNPSTVPASSRATRSSAILGQPACVDAEQPELESSATPMLPKLHIPGLKSHHPTTPTTSATPTTTRVPSPS